MTKQQSKQANELQKSINKIDTIMRKTSKNRIELIMDKNHLQHELDKLIYS